MQKIANILLISLFILTSCSINRATLVLNPRFSYHTSFEKNNTSCNIRLSYYYDREFSIEEETSYILNLDLDTVIPGKRIDINSKNVRFLFSIFNTLSAFWDDIPESNKGKGWIKIKSINDEKLIMNYRIKIKQQNRRFVYRGNSEIYSASSK